MSAEKPKPAAPIVKRPYKRKSPNQATWTAPVVLPTNPVSPNATHPEKTNKKGFEWKQPTRGWRNGLPPGTRHPTPATSDPRVGALPVPLSNIKPQATMYRSGGLFAGRNCTPNFFGQSDDSLCGFALCASRASGPYYQPVPPVHQQATNRMGRVDVDTSVPLPTNRHYFPDDNKILVDKLFQEESEETGGLWKLVTDLFSSPLPAPSLQPAATTTTNMYPAFYEAHSGPNFETSAMPGAPLVAPYENVSPTMSLGSVHETGALAPLGAVDGILEIEDMMSLYADTINSMPPKPPPMHMGMQQTKIEQDFLPFDTCNMDPIDVTSQFDSKGPGPLHALPTSYDRD